MSTPSPPPPPCVHQGCEYDWGDCCECTCVGTSCESTSFCADPNSDCVDPRIGEYPNCTDGWIGSIGDGHCDSDSIIDNNMEASITELQALYFIPPCSPDPCTVIVRIENAHIIMYKTNIRFHIRFFQ